MLDEVSGARLLVNAQNNPLVTVNVAPTVVKGVAVAR